MHHKCPQHGASTSVCGIMLVHSLLFVGLEMACPAPSGLDILASQSDIEGMFINEQNMVYKIQETSCDYKF